MQRKANAEEPEGNRGTRRGEFELEGIEGLEEME